MKTTCRRAPELALRLVGAASFAAFASLGTAAQTIGPKAFTGQNSTIDMGRFAIQRVPGVHGWEWREEVVS